MMGRTTNRSARRELDRKLASIPRNQLVTPRTGWVRALRQALGMSAADLASRMGVTSGAVLNLEHSEVAGGVTLDRLSRAAQAMDCELVYALVPRTSLSETVERQARFRIAHEVQATGRAMDLEAQGTALDPDTISEQVQALIDTRQLWKQDRR
jgi:predicted DNA-binding mobile mystery protein A